MDSISPLESKIKELQERIKVARLPADLAEKLKEEVSVLELSLKGDNSFINFENFSNYVNFRIPKVNRNLGVSTFISYLNILQFLRIAENKANTGYHNTLRDFL